MRLPESGFIVPEASVETHCFALPVCPRGMITLEMERLRGECICSLLFGASAHRSARDSALRPLGAGAPWFVWWSTSPASERWTRAGRMRTLGSAGPAVCVVTGCAWNSHPSPCPARLWAEESVNSSMKQRVFFRRQVFQREDGSDGKISRTRDEETPVELENKW